MKYPLPLILLAICLTTSAGPIRREGPAECCFSLVARGPPNGTVEEDTIGENRIGGIFPQGTYCISNATLTDFGGRTCVILPSTGQFLCENIGIATSSRFTIADNGNLLHDGCPNYYACPSTGPGNDGSYNIFSDNIANPTGCLNITILTGGYSCAALGRPSSTLATSTATNTAETVSLTTPTSSISNEVPVSGFTTASSATPTSTSGASCPTDISSGTYLAPNLIIPVSPESPDTAFGSRYIATITPVNITTFTFDIPLSYTGNCALIFQFPFSSSAQFPFLFTGIEEEEGKHGGLRFTLLTGPVDATTTFNSMPGIQYDFGTLMVFPGNNYTVGVGQCFTGQRISFQVESVGGVGLEYFQSVGASPMGVFAVPCS